MVKYEQTLITKFISKNKTIQKEHQKEDQLKVEIGCQYEDDSTVWQNPVKIEQNKLKIDSNVVSIKISPQIANIHPIPTNQERQQQRHGQILLTQRGFRTTGNQIPFHTICAECGCKLKNSKSKALCRGPTCNKKHMARKATR